MMYYSFTSWYTSQSTTFQEIEIASRHVIPLDLHRAGQGQLVQVQINNLDPHFISPYLRRTSIRGSVPSWRNFSGWMCQMRHNRSSKWHQRMVSMYIWM